MEKILAIIGSNKPKSVNKKLVEFIAPKLQGYEVKLHNWIHFEAPVFDFENAKEGVFPADIRILKDQIDQYKILIFAVSEQNLSVSAFFKNIVDWLMAMDPQFLKDKKILLMSTSKDDGGSINALNYMQRLVPFAGGQILESFSIPNFQESFDKETEELIDETFRIGLLEVLTNFESQLEMGALENRFEEEKKEDK